MEKPGKIFIVFSYLFCICMATVVSSEKYGEFLLAGSFPLHFSHVEKSEQCGNISTRGVQMMEAMLYAAEQINRNSKFWNFSLKTVIVDSCYSTSRTIAETREVLNSHPTGFISGGGGRTVNKKLSALLSRDQIPLISDILYSKDLGKTTLYPNVFRVVPSLDYQVKLLLELLQKMHWTSVSTVTAEDTGPYGNATIRAFKEDASSLGICFGSEAVIPKEAKKQDYVAVIENLLKAEQSRAVMVFFSPNTLQKLYDQAKESGVTPGRFLWIGINGWIRNNFVVSVRGDTEEESMIILSLRSPLPGDAKISAIGAKSCFFSEFDEYFKSLKPDSHQETGKLWFKEFWEHLFGCSFSKSDSSTPGRSKCTGHEDIHSVTNYKQYGSVPIVMDAVFVMAHALRNMCIKEPNDCQNNTQRAPGPKLMGYIQNVSFPSFAGRGIRVSFDSRRSLAQNLSIFQKQKTPSGDVRYVLIGNWSTDGLHLNGNQNEMIESTCKTPCKPGMERVYDHRSNKCCWTCRKCQDIYFLPSETTPCRPCESGLVPNDNYTSCIFMEPEYFGKHFSNPWTSFPFNFSILGLIFCTVTYVAFWIYHDTPIIRSSCTELCHMIVFGVFLCYSFTFLMMLQPSPLSCTFVRLGLGLGLVICNSAVFTKTSRIARIFDQTMISLKLPRYLKTKFLLIISICLGMTQLTLSAIELFIWPPEVTSQRVEDVRPYVETCKTKSEIICVTLAFNGILIIICTVCAYKVRNVPENFNEAKHISFAMYCTCIIWMAFVPAYFGVPTNCMVKSSLLCISVSMNGTVILVCIFVPKLYVAISHASQRRSVQQGIRMISITTGAHVAPGVSQRT